MITKKQYEQGLEIEKEHKETYKWLSDYVKKNKGKLPESYEFYLHIAHDHLKENEKYYDVLKKANL